MAGCKYLSYLIDLMLIIMALTYMWSYSDHYEYRLDMVGVGGSSPLGRTISSFYLLPYYFP